MKKKLFLLDAMAILFRSHFAFIKNPRKTTTGLNTSAIYGFSNTLLEILTKEEPTHIAVAFDTSTPTFRHVHYPEYKAHRDETPEDLIAAFPFAYQLLEALNIPALRCPGFEADDIIGTLSAILPEDEYDIYMVTPDKDYAQLVKSNVFLYRPSTSKTEQGYEIYDREKVVTKYGIPPEQVIDYLALTGDVSDNIPGVPKVGEKTAIALLQEFGSWKGIKENVDKITKNAIRESLKANIEKGDLSYYLATIKIDMDLSAYPPDNMAVTPADMEKLMEVLGKLEFRTMGQRLLNSRFNPVGTQAQTDLFGNPLSGSVPQVNHQKNETKNPLIPESASQPFGDFQNIKDVEHHYELLETPAQFEKLVAEIRELGFVSFDTETTSLDERSAKIVGISFCKKQREAFFILCDKEYEKAKETLDYFKEILEDENILKIGQNLKYDIQILKNYDIQVKGKLFDTMLAHYVLMPEGKHGMDDMARKLLKYSPISYKELTLNNKIPLRNLKIEDLVNYAAEDADITFQLYQYLEEKIAGNKIYEEIEMPLMPVLTEMEYEGVKIDKQFLNDYSAVLDTQLKELERQIHQIAGIAFNVNSPAQLGEVLFDKLKLGGKPKKTKTGQYVTDEDVLVELAAKGDSELPAIMLIYRGLKKLKSTYVDALPELINEETGRVHTTFSQSVAVTGRLSSINPNLQNIPIRSEEGKEVRKSFVARNEDYLVFSADYSQVELRIMAAFSKDADMIKAFQQGEDIHRATAAKVFGVELSEVTPDMRSKAKTVNFGIIYGVSAFGLAQQLRISRTEAKKIIDAYFEKYPTIKNFMDKCISDARTNGYVETYFGRKRYLPEIHSQNAVVRGFAERNAINSPIQGTAADIIKIAMIRIADAFKKENIQSKMVLQVHDELLFEVYKPELERVKQIVSEQMIHAVDLEVPMDVGMGVGANWLEAH
jgi:DNA polymerase-1